MTCSPIPDLLVQSAVDVTCVPSLPPFQFPEVRKELRQSKPSLSQSWQSCSPTLESWSLSALQIAAKTKELPSAEEWLREAVPTTTLPASEMRNHLHSLPLPLAHQNLHPDPTGNSLSECTSTPFPLEYVGTVTSKNLLGFTESLCLKLELFPQ